MAILRQFCGDIFPGTYFLDQLKLKATLELEDELLVEEATLELEDELLVAEEILELEGELFVAEEILELEDELLEFPSGETVHPTKPKETTTAKTKNKRKKVKNLAGSKIKVFFFILSP
jgi:hypothetical protein